MFWIEPYQKVVAGVLVAILIGTALVSRWNSPALPADYPTEYYKTFIETTCCYTNKCCVPIEESHVQNLANGQFYITDTGETVTAKEFSPDENYYICNCKLSNLKGWASDYYAQNFPFTRCFFPPIKGF